MKRLLVSTLLGATLLWAGAGCRDGRAAAPPNPDPLASTAAQGAQGAQAKEGWLDSWAAASARARELGKPVLINFAKSTECATCGLLDESVFLTPVFQSWASQNVVLLQLDFASPTPEAQGLAKNLDVIGYPTVVLVDADGKKLGALRYQEGGGPEAFVKKAAGLIANEEPPALPWHHSYDEAAATALKEKKLLLIDFTGSDWCVFCHKLRDEVWSSEQFRQWFEPRFVLLEADFPRNLELEPQLAEQNQMLLEKYGVEGFPTVVFCDPAGNLKGRLGYLPGGPAAWIKEAEKSLANAGPKGDEGKP